MEARHIRVSGRVQGVGFRAWLCAQARALGAHGWVRNCRDGTVEALLIGSAEVVAALLLAARRGPPAANVSQLLVEAVAPDAALPSGEFSLRADA